MSFDWRFTVSTAAFATGAALTIGLDPLLIMITVLLTDMVYWTVHHWRGWD